ncbi:MAG TPA: DUF6799 domain-containing protein [Bacteroidia bacterium]|jgi:hypothetical protein
MKKQITFIVGCVFAVSAASQEIYNEQDPAVKPERYCATLKDGKILLMLDNKPVDAEVSLLDGSKVTTAGIVVRKDGTVVNMNDGDCVDKEGNISNVNPTIPIMKRQKNK